MKQGVKIITITALLTGLSGCSQISKTADTLWGGTKSAANFVASPVKKLLRGSPKQDYVFTDDGADVEIYQTSAPQYASSSPYANGSYSVEIYDTPALRPAPVQNYVMTNPRDVSFVSLNGQSDAQDWRNCEITSRGYLMTSTTDFRLNPEFEVCMRNKGYVTEAEVAHYGTYYGKGISAPKPVSSYNLGYSYP